MRTITRAELFEKLGAFESVQNTTARCGYGNAANQFELRFKNGRAFQSYQSLIAVRYNGEWYFTDYHDYSNTTSRHLGRWCGICTNERRKGLEDGTFINIVD